MRCEEGPRRFAQAVDFEREETEELEEEGLFWEVAAQLAAQLPQEGDEVDASRQPDAGLGQIAITARQAERSYVPPESMFAPMPRATRGFQSPVLLSPRITHRVIDLTARSFSSGAPAVDRTTRSLSSALPKPQEQRRPWTSDRLPSGTSVQVPARQGCSRLRKSMSAEVKQKAGASAGCPALGRRRPTVDTAAPRSHHAAPVAAMPQSRTLLRTGTGTTPLIGTAPSSPQSLRPSPAPPRPLPSVAPLPGFGSACASVALSQPRRPSSPLGGSVRPVPAGSGSWPPAAQQPAPAVHTWVSVGEVRGRGEPILGLHSAPAQVARPVRASLPASRIQEEDALANSGNVSTIAPADEHQDESFTGSEVAGSMIISNREQAMGSMIISSREQVTVNSLLGPDETAENGSESDTSSLHHDGLVNETQLIYPIPDRTSCAPTPRPMTSLASRSPGAGSHASGPVAVYLGREPAAQVSVGTTASTSTGVADSEANSELATLEGWCRSVGLSEVVLQRLKDECVQHPDHLIHCEKEDIKSLTEGLRIGDKISLINAVQQLKESVSSRAGHMHER